MIRYLFSKLAGSMIGLAIAATPILPALAEPSPAKAKTEREFKAWLTKTAWPAAKRRGVKRKTFDAALKGVVLDWSLPDLRPPGASQKAPKVQRQAEFRAPQRYFRQNNLNTLVAIGRKRLKRHDKALRTIENRYGVPRRIIMAIWGRETGYGGAKIPYYALRSLATLGFMGRRKEFFYNEFLGGLQILQESHITRAQLKSSWAGAMGHPQFIPSMYLNHAVDFNQDGKRDIWNTVPDALASIANLLANEGWQRNRDWGFEAIVPDAVSCTLNGPDQGRPLREWIERGVTRVADRPWPASELEKETFLLMPAGRAGPAWIVTKNFYVLKKYNESDLYALFIGHLADRYGNNRQFIQAWDKSGRFSRREVQIMQERLEKRGYDVGGADGLIGFKTRRAIGQWQQAKGLRPSCWPTAKLVKTIR